MNKMGIRAKLLGVILIFVVTVIGVFSVGLYSLTYMNSRNDIIQNTLVHRRSLSNRLLISILRATVEQQKLIYQKDTQHDKLLSEYNLFLKESEGYLNDLQKVNSASISSKLKETESLFVDWSKASISVNELVAQNNAEQAVKDFILKIEPVQITLQKKIQEILEISKMDMDDHIRTDDEVFKVITFVCVGTVLIGLIIGCLSAYLVIKKLLESLITTTSKIAETAQSMTQTAQNLSASSSELSTASTQQAASLEQTSAAIEEMNSMVRRNADAARDCTIITNDSVKSTVHGQSVVDKMLQSMNEIQDSNTALKEQTDISSKEFGDMVNVINEISNKTTIINEIVFQTKLLSFNASVEAARAGEHGKGFAVVAEEIGNLAQMSGGASKEIAGLLDSSLIRVKAVIEKSRVEIENLSDQNRQKIIEGGVVANECRDVLEEIASKIKEISEMADSISQASDEQSKGVSEINKAITQLDQVTQANASSSQKSASTAERLLGEADTLRQSSDDLAFIIDGKAE
ncbi:MAG: hypothetical protein EOP07_00475 [Proteobacteria bacterium]|nr:MAG: hypothetical protein EOP07_00475 [Pseudomonadota bacterium]